MDYNSVGVLGRGGSAVVELAVDANGREVATKRVALTGSAEQIRVARQRLRREAEILGRLQHRGIVPVLDVVDDGSELILVFPAFPENLEDRVGRLGPLPTEAVERIGEVLIGALAAAHRHGVVHRDIKPSNVLFDEAGEPALADFGMAVTWEVTAGLTEPGTVVGTPTWMAPEQARGEPPSPASDVFSLAATLLFAATGAGGQPRPRAPEVTTRAGRRRLRDLLDGLQPPLHLPLAAMLDPRPDHRPSAAALLGGPDGTGAVAATSRRRLFGRRGSRPPRRSQIRPVRWLDHPNDRPATPLRKRLAWVGGIALVALAAGVVGLGLSGPKSTPAPRANGTACQPGQFPAEGNAANGCGARSDYVAGRKLVQGAPLHANLVPVSAADTFTTHVSGSFSNLCWGSLHVTLTAPPATAEQLTVWKGTTQVAKALSANGVPATAVVHKPSCFAGDREDLQVTVTAIAATGEASAADFTLTRDGGW